MKRLVIAVDCDDVLVHTTAHFINEYNRLYGTNVAIENAYLLDSPEFEGVERYLIHERFDRISNSDDFKRLVPRPDAIEAIGRLANVHELHLVTARQISQELVTLQMLNKYFLDCFSEVHHLHEESKGKVCQLIHADVIIDDNAKHLLDARGYGVRDRIWFGSYPWQLHDDSFDGFTARAGNWAEVEQIISRLAREQ